MNTVISDRLSTLGFTGALNEKLLKFFQSNGASSSNIDIAADQYLITKGFSSGGINDRWAAYWKSLGYSGAYNDIGYKFWLNLSTDPYFANTVLLLNLNSLPFTDVKGKTVTNNGVQLSGSSKFGTGSAQFPSLSYLFVPSSTDFNFGTGDFTIEVFVYHTTTGDYRCLLDARGSDTLVPFSWFIDPTNKVYFLGSTGSAVLTTTSVPVNTWTHLALVRTSGVIKMFIDGVEGYSGADSGAFNTGAALRIGGREFGSTAFSFLGNMDDLRITKGVARYTSNFTPPTSQLI